MSTFVHRTLQTTHTQILFSLNNIDYLQQYIHRCSQVIFILYNA